jgi:hypothetical protein
MSLNHLSTQNWSKAGAHSLRKEDSLHLPTMLLFVAGVHGLLSNNVLRFSRSTFIISSRTRIWHLNLVISAINKAADVEW